MSGEQGAWLVSIDLVFLRFFLMEVIREYEYHTYSMMLFIYVHSLDFQRKTSFIVTSKDLWHPPSMLEMLLEKGSFYKTSNPHPLSKNFKVPMKRWRILDGQS